MSLRYILGSVFTSMKSRNQYRACKSEHIAERIARGMEEIQRAQDQFAIVMTQYVEQLKNHTSAIEGLSKASRELKNSAAEQNKVFTRLVNFVELLPARAEPSIPEPEEANRAENTEFPSGCYRRRPSRNKDEQVLAYK